MIMSDEYLDQVVEEIYEICTRGIDWPPGFNADKRKKMLNSLIGYYQRMDTHEGYKKCARLRDIIMMIEIFDKKLIQKETKNSGSIDLFKN